MRTVKVHPTQSINFTVKAMFWTEITNAYKRLYPHHSFKVMAENLNLSETNARRYYYGVHHCNPGANGYTQMRQGACVALQ